MRGDLSLDTRRKRKHIALHAFNDQARMSAMLSRILYEASLGILGCLIDAANQLRLLPKLLAGLRCTVSIFRPLLLGRDGMGRDGKDASLM